MKFIVFLVMGFSFSLSAIASSPLVLEEEMVNEIERRLDSGILVGIVIGIIDPSGERYVSFGKTSLDSDRQPDENTTFDIGSISKTFTSTLLADMVARGEISFNEPIKNYLPKNVSVPLLGEQEITPWHLATHSSGLPRRPYNVIPDDPWDTYGNYTVDDFYDALAQVELSHDVGSKFSYSSFGAGLLAHTLSLRANTDIESLISRRITTELEMSNTSSQLLPNITEHLAQGYSYHVPTLSHVNPVWPSLKSSPKDMLQYIGANLNLVESSLNTAMKSTHKVQLQEGLARFKQGLGWWVDNSEGKSLVLHNGFTHGYRSFAGFDTKANKGVIVLSNSNGFIDDIGLRLLGSPRKLRMFKPPLSIALYEALQDGDFNSVMAKFSGMSKKELDAYDINEDGINDTGLYYVRTGNIDKGIEILQYALTLKPESSNIYDSLGWSYEQAGDNESAIISYKKALNIDPNTWSAEEKLRRLEYSGG